MAYFSRSVSTSIGWGAKSNAVGREDHVIGHFARGLQILIEERGRHGQRLAGVVEAGGVGGIDGELAGGAHVDAGEVADGVVVLGVAEAARQHGTGIAGVLARFGGADVTDPVDDGLASFGGRLLDAFGRHLTGGQFLEYEIPAGVIVEDGGDGGIRAEVELGGRIGAAVASDAIGGDEGFDGLREALFQVGIGCVGRAHPGVLGTAEY